MHLNYYFLTCLAAELNTILEGSFLADIFTQDKDEIVLGFGRKGKDIYLKCQTGPGLQCLSFPVQFQRARRNSTDLFKKASGLAFSRVTTSEADRSFQIHLQNNTSLFFKMHGSKSNVILYQNEKGTEQFHKSFPDLEPSPESYQKLVSFDMQQLAESEFDFKKYLPALGKQPLKWLEQQGFQRASEENKIELVCRMLGILHHPEQYYILAEENKAILSFFPTDEVLATATSAMEAANLFLKWHYSFTVKNKNSQQEQKLLEGKKHKLEGYIVNVNKRIAEIDKGLHLEQTGDILMANLHAIPANSEKVTLFDFYRNEEIEIKLKKDLSPQKNAEQYYRKAKNTGLERANLLQTIEQKKEELNQVNTALEHLAQGIVPVAKHLESQKPKQELQLPYKTFECEGFEIRVGKNSQKNDEMILHYAAKNDLWMHARGYAGSHVLVKSQPGKAFPKQVVEKAAALAAYYSKGKADSLCPVIVTERKYVRKSKGMAAGQVTVEKEQVILVKPQEFYS